MAWSNKEIGIKWERIKDIRKTITEAIEISRNEKIVGSSLECEITVYTPNRTIYDLMTSIDVAELTIVSKATITYGQIPSGAYTQKDIGITVMKATGTKCERCWKISPEVTALETKYGKVALCKRCREII